MSFGTEIVDDWQRLPTWGKVIAISALGLVVILGLIALANRQKNAANSSGLTTGGGADIGGTDGSGATLNFPGTPPPTTTPTTPPPGKTPTVPVPPPSSSTPIKPTTPAKPTVKPPAPKPSTYTVQAGDTLSTIAARLHIKGGWQALWNANRGDISYAAWSRGINQANQIGYANYIFPGEKLSILGLT